LLVLFDPVDNSDLTTFSVLKGGANYWSYSMRIPRLYGSTTNSPTPVPITLYIPLTTNDYLNFTFTNSPGQLSSISAGTTINITGLAQYFNNSPPS
jgi:hypothetical protein